MCYSISYVLLINPHNNHVRKIIICPSYQMVWKVKGTWTKIHWSKTQAENFFKYFGANIMSRIFDLMFKPPFYGFLYSFSSKLCTVMPLVSQFLDCLCFFPPRRPGLCEWGRIPGNLWHQTWPVRGVWMQRLEWCCCPWCAESKNHCQLWVDPLSASSRGKESMGIKGTKS